MVDKQIEHAVDYFSKVKPKLVAHIGSQFRSLNLRSCFVGRGDVGEGGRTIDALMEPFF